MTPEVLREWARQAGFGRTGFCSVSAFESARRRVQTEPPIAERRQLRFDPAADDPQAECLAVLLWPYAQTDAPPDCVEIDAYYAASNAAYHAARALEAQVCAEGVYARANVAYPAREAAVRAGLGMMGKNGLLITKDYGTRVVILLMALGFPPPAPDVPEDAAGGCLACGRCARACPAGAIDARGMTHPERCLRNFMLEGVVVPEALRERMGRRLVGCDICQRVCPMQPAVACAPDASPALPLDALVTDDDRAFSAACATLAARVGKNLVRPQRVRAQVALLAGNRARQSDRPVLESWARSPFEAVREHARWAVARLDERAALDPARETRYNTKNSP